MTGKEIVEKWLQGSGRSEALAAKEANDMQYKYLESLIDYSLSESCDCDSGISVEQALDVLDDIPEVSSLVTLIRKRL